MHKSYLKKISLMLILVFTLSVGVPINAQGFEKREYTVYDELMTYQMFYDSIKYMKRGKAKLAFNEFMSKKLEYSKLNLKKNVSTMNETQFNEYLKKSKLPLHTSKEKLFLDVDKKCNQLKQRLENTTSSMSNKEIKVTVKEMVKTINKTQKRGFLVGALAGAGIVATVAFVGIVWMGYAMMQSF